MNSTRLTEEEPPDAVTAADHYVLGGGNVSTAVAKRLHADGRAVAVVSESHDSSELRGYRGDPADARVLDAAGLSEASSVIVATRSDSRNLLIAQLVRAHFDVPKVVALANAPDRRSAFAAAGLDPVCGTAAVSDALVDSI